MRAEPGDMTATVVSVVPTALAFAAILSVGYVLARLLRSALARVLHRVGFHRAVDRGGIGRALRAGGVDAVDLCAKIGFYAVLLMTLQLGFGVWGPNPVSDLLADLIGWLPDAFAAIVIVVVAAALAGAVRDRTGALSREGSTAPARVAAALIVAVGIVAALDQVGIATSVTVPVLIAVLATVAGVFVVGVGGGLIRPLQRRWAGWLARAGTESRVIREHARAYADALAARAEAARRAAEERAAQERAAQEQAAQQRAAEERAARERAAAKRAAEERAAEERAAQAAREQAAKRSRNAAHHAAEAQTIPPLDDALSIVPGFDRYDDGWDTGPGFDPYDDDGERTQVLPPPRTPTEDETQVIPDADTAAQPPADTGSTRRSRLRRRPWT